MAAKKNTKKQTKKTNKQTKTANKKRVPTKIKKAPLGETIAAKHPRNFMADEVWNFILAIMVTFVAIFLIASKGGHGGPVGEFTHTHLSSFVGAGYWLLPALLLVLGYSFLREMDRDFHPMKILGSVMFITSGLGAMDLLFENGGWLGGMLSRLESPIGFAMALLLMFILFLVSLFLILDHVPFVSRAPWDEEEESVATKNKKPAAGDLSQEEIERIAGKDSVQKLIKKPKQPVLTAAKKPKKPLTVDDSEINKIEQSIDKKINETFGTQKQEPKTPENKNTEKPGKNPVQTVSAPSATVVPPMNILAKDKGKIEKTDTAAAALTIKRTLSNFGIDVEMAGAEVGPTVTRYAFKPAEGVKLAKIAGLKDDLSLALAAKTLRMETPIPGQSLVGIEIPNRNSTMVGFGSLLSSPDFAQSSFSLPLAIGKNIAGEPAFISMDKAPHILVAGTTGAGKSVTVHALITSMLYKHGPDMLKFIMVDPKRVEMTLYNGIPHLLTPVITDAKTTIISLKWAIKEMERRLEVLQENGVRDIGSYHSNVVEKHVPTEENEAPEKMPYIVIVIDELADIMQAYPKELEAGIVTLAQKSRAAGIHLIISTQRPSVNVITGTIKANVPTRLALQVASAIDSRTILDMGGAEQLLGKGDMLYMTGDMSKPVRVQCAYLSEDEVKKVVVWLKKHYRGEVPDEIDLSTKAVADSNVMFAGSIGEDDDEDDLYGDAKQAVIEAGKASTSYIQRRLRVGYSRAARLMDMLEEKGVIGPADGSKPREILSTGEESADEPAEQDNEGMLS